MESLVDVSVSEEDAAAAIAKTAVIKLNGGLGHVDGDVTARSRCSACAAGLSFLDVICASGAPPAPRSTTSLAAADLHEQLPHLRRTRWPRSPATTTSPVEGLPLEFLQNKEPKLLRLDDLSPGQLPARPVDLEWCPPGHGDLFTALMRHRAARDG